MKNRSRFVRGLLIALSFLFLVVMLVVPLIFVFATAFQDGWKDNAFQTGAAWGDNLMNGVSNALSGSSAAASGAAGP